MPKARTSIIKTVINAEKIIDKSITLYGPTRTGKSTVIKNLCETIYPYIALPYLFCSSANLNNDFKGIIPDWLISRTLTEGVLNKLIDSQAERRANIDRAEEYAREFWPIIRDRRIDAEYEEEMKKIGLLTSTYGALATEQQNAELETRKFRAEFKRNMSIRKTIKQRRRELYEKTGFRINERSDDPQYMRLVYFEKFFRLNNRMLLIIDDCTDMINNISDETWKRLYNKSRHYGITVMMAVHNVQDLKVPCLRTAPFFSIFTSPSVATYFVTNATTGAKNIVNPDPGELQAILGDKVKPRKIIFDRDLGSLGVFEFKTKVEPIRIGNPIMWKYQSYLDSKRKALPESFDRSYL